MNLNEFQYCTNSTNDDILLLLDDSTSGSTLSKNVMPNGFTLKGRLVIMTYSFRLSWILLHSQSTFSSITN